MVPTNQKSIIDIHTKKRKEHKYNTKNSHEITKEEYRRRKEFEKLQKQIQNN